MDEYGLGGKGEFCFTGCVKNPLNLSKSTAGSSSGSVCNVAMGFSTFAIATDTGDSIVKPSSYVGVIGYKPTCKFWMTFYSSRAILVGDIFL